jgi:hypothetical protein
MKCFYSMMQQKEKTRIEIRFFIVIIQIFQSGNADCITICLKMSRQIIYSIQNQFLTNFLLIIPFKVGICSK